MLARYTSPKIRHIIHSSVSRSKRQIGDLAESHSEDWTDERIAAVAGVDAPFILRGAAAHFPAISLWSDLTYLKEKIGDVHMDVEIGQYNSKEEPLSIPFQMYVTDYLERANQTEDLPQEHTLYIAQNDLPKALEDDLVLPRLCTSAMDEVSEGRLYQRNLWLGPKGCVSPLHHDPLNNFLFQIVGRKTIICVDRYESPQVLRAGKAYNQQTNTSSLSLDELDDIKSAESAVLEPGDVLFLPHKWWHAARSETYSVSANVWWR